MGLVVLVGVSGSGKSTFAAPALHAVAGHLQRLLPRTGGRRPERPGGHTDAFDVLHYIVGTRLRRGLLTVVDATSVQQRGTAVARRAGPRARRAGRRDRARRTGASRLRAQRRPAGPRLRRPRGRPSAPRPQEVAAWHPQGGVPAGARAHAASTRSRPPPSRPSGPGTTAATSTGPFDIVGDVHGCAGRAAHPARPSSAGSSSTTTPAVPSAPATPRADRASSSATSSTAARTRPGVLRLVMGMVAAGTALCVSGNHEAKLVRALQGRQGPGQPRPRRVAGAAGRGEPRSSAPRRWRSWTG